MDHFYDLFIGLIARAMKTKSRNFLISFAPGTGNIHVCDDGIGISKALVTELINNNDNNANECSTESNIIHTSSSILDFCEKLLVQISKKFWSFSYDGRVSDAQSSICIRSNLFMDAISAQMLDFTHDQLCLSKNVLSFNVGTKIFFSPDDLMLKCKDAIGVLSFTNSELSLTVSSGDKFLKNSKDFSCNRKNTYCIYNLDFITIYCVASSVVSQNYLFLDGLIVNIHEEIFAILNQYIFKREDIDKSLISFILQNSTKIKYIFKVNGDLNVNFHEYVRFQEFVPEVECRKLIENLIVTSLQAISSRLTLKSKQLLTEKIPMQSRTIQSLKSHAFKMSFTESFRSMLAIAQLEKNIIIASAEVWDHSKSRSRSILIAIDQHAADERIRLENIESQLFLEDSTKFAHMLDREWIFEVDANIPQSFRISQWSFDADIHIREYNKDNKCTLVVRCIPKILRKCFLNDEVLLKIVKSIFQEMIDDLFNSGSLSFPSQLYELMKSASCRSAIKFGKELNFEKMQEILDSLCLTRNPHLCAHGRVSIAILASF